MNNASLREIINDMRDNNVSANKLTELGEYKKLLIEFVKNDKIFDEYENLENLKLLYEVGSEYDTFKSDVAKFWFKGIYDEIHLNVTDKIAKYDKIIENTYSDVFPKEYKRVESTEDIYKIREDYWGKIDILKYVLSK